MDARRTISLRQEHDGNDHRYLDAALNAAGDLVLVGHDLGPGTAMVSSDGEYEWSRTVRREHLEALLGALGAAAGANVLDVLARDWTGPASHDLETLLRNGAVPSEVHVV